MYAARLRAKRSVCRSRTNPSELNRAQVLTRFATGFERKQVVVSIYHRGADYTLKSLFVKNELNIGMLRSSKSRSGTVRSSHRLLINASFPAAMALAWIAAIFEVALTAALLTGAFFAEAGLLAAAYVLFLGFAFHGPSHWSGNQAEFGLFVDHFTFVAGLLFAAVHGPGKALAVGRGRVWRPESSAAGRGSAS